MLPFAWSVSYLLVASSTNDEPSTWSRRTAKRRQHMDQLLSSIQLPPNSLLQLQFDHDTNSPNDNPSCTLDSLYIPILDVPEIPWPHYPLLDPEQSGRLAHNSPRSRRKRVQVQAFCHVVASLSTAASNSTIVDAGSGAGNLAIAMAGWLRRPVLALDVNPVALQQLSQRAESIPNCSVTTFVADLADQTIPLPANTAVLCSLHACGAATDMALQLAIRHDIAFVTSPCCTAKSMVQRQAKYGPSASLQRSGAPADIVYPRSQWLRQELERYIESSSSNDSSSNESSSGSSSSHDKLFEFYAKLAKVADVGLGPQTPLEQRRHQRLAKYAVELDRLCGIVEQHPQYRVWLVRLPSHEDYGKAELLIGVPNKNIAGVEALNELVLRRA